MASPHSHRSSTSIASSNNLAPPEPTPNYKPQRRMTSPALPPPSAIDIPQPVYGNNHTTRRSPSPLRNSHTPDPDTGAFSEDGSDNDSDEDERDATWGRSHSPNSSITQMATSFAQRVGSMMNGRSGHMLTDEELKAQAEMERDRSRREAERILIQEAEERRLMEDKVLSMLATSPRPRAQTMPAMDPPSPATSQKEGSPSWWVAAKNRLTPTKDPLTPAQQVVQETKEKDKKGKKEAKKQDKRERKKSNDWPTSSETKYADPAFLNLTTPPGPPRRPPPSSPSSPTPGAPKHTSLPPSLAPSPLRSGASQTASPSREATPLYAQFNEQGTLDLPGTLLVVARRFEKLEKWTVGHVRALEERMSDVERFLVEREHEREHLAAEKKEGSSEVTEQAMSEMRDELVELQGRIGELGREMAKLATAPANLSGGPSRSPAPVSTAPPTSSSLAIHSQTPPTTPRVVSPSHPRRESMSPTFVPLTVPSNTPRSRLPYPTGDYATPPDTVLLSQGTFSPTNSPPSSLTSRTRPMSVAGLPSLGGHTLTTQSSNNSLSGLPRSMSPPGTSPSPSNNQTNLAALAALTAPRAPKAEHSRQTSISPTPRKRYTVALGGPVMKGPRPDSPSPTSEGDSDTDTYDETIGKSAGRTSSSVRNGYTSDATAPVPKRPKPSSLAPLTTPLRVRARSQSTDRIGIASDMATTPLGTKFVDPLLMRRQEKLARANAAPPALKAAAGKPRAPVGDLVAFFDKDKI
ncbi:hypothetical protein OF83DRAFT_1172482 [Amylostereum chailletii]|nr:hypothetical protein OF83DRAFT_1172482 [Amylostereum chailletii]